MFKFMKALRFHPNCKVTSYPAAVPLTRTEDTRLLRQRKTTVTHSKASDVSFLFSSFLLAPRVS